MSTIVRPLGLISLTFLTRFNNSEEEYVFVCIGFTKTPYPFSISRLQYSRDSAISFFLNTTRSKIFFSAHSGIFSIGYSPKFIIKVYKVSEHCSVRSFSKYEIVGKRVSFSLYSMFFRNPHSIYST